MGDVSKIKMPDNSIQNVKDKVARETIETKMPFYTIGTPTVLVNTTTVSFSKDGDNNWYISGENPISLSISSSDIGNSIFFIEWDNVEYKLFLKMIQDTGPVRGVTSTGYFDWWAIGNISTIGFGSTLADIEAPFAVTVDYMKNAGERYIISYDTAVSHTIKISKASFTKTVCDPAYYADTRKTGYPPIRFTSNNGSVAESGASKSSGAYSHAEGVSTVASGDNSHAEGASSTASGFISHAEGLNTEASGGWGAHAEGYNTTASGNYSHAEGCNTIANNGSHTEGYSTTANNGSHAEGQFTTASGNISHVEGEYTIANHRYQHVFGKANIEDPSTEAANKIGNYVEIVGNGTWETIEGEKVITRSNARTLDWSGNEVLAGDLTYNGNTSLTSTISNINTASSNKMDKTNPTGTGSFSLNRKANTTVGTNSFAEGNDTEASGNYSHAEGEETTASGTAAHTEGKFTLASGYGAHAEGAETIASGNYSHSEGDFTEANGGRSHAEGAETTASGDSSHAEGFGTTASGNNSHAEGYSTTASGTGSSATGRSTIANHKSQHVFGEYNVADTNAAAATDRGTYVEIVGNGTANNARSNARTLDWNGNEVLAGTIEATDFGTTLNNKIATIAANNNTTYTFANGTNGFTVTPSDGVAQTVTVTPSITNNITGSGTSGNLAKFDGANTITDGPGIDTSPTSSSTNVITSGGVYTSLSNKMNKTNPTGTGSFSLNRKANTTIGDYSFAEGYNTTASGQYSHAEGNGATASAYGSHAEGISTTASQSYAHAEGNYTEASGTFSHAEGARTKATLEAAHAEGYGTTASGMESHAEGFETTASGQYSHAEGKSTTASGDYSHAEGNGTTTTASAESSHAEGSGTTASGKYAHAEGIGTTASGNGYGAHAEGYNTRATGNYSHSAGYDSTASGAGSTATGRSTIANHRSQYVFGEYNVADTSTAASNKPGDYIEIVGNGIATNDRSNARTLDWSGNEVLSGSLTCTSVTQTSSREVKKNIELMSEEEAKKILKLDAVSFDFKDEKLGSNKRGFIAEDVKEILPNLVIDKTTTNPMSLDYISIIPYLQYIIKKQDERITELEKILKEKL